jgi:hypothetical protein
MSFVKLQVANSYHGVLIIINCDDERAFVGHIKINQSKQAKVYHQGFLNLFCSYSSLLWTCIQFVVIS